MRAKSQIATHWFLDSVAGWHAAHTEHLTLTQPDGYWRLDPLPGGSMLPLDRTRQDAEFTCPSGIAVDRCRGTLVADAAASVLKLIPPSIPTTALPSISSAGKQPGQLNQPRGVAWLAGGAIAVADTANHRVQILTKSPYSVLQVWGARDGSGQPKPGSWLLEFNRPWSVVVDDKCVLWIADRGNHRIQKIQSDGTWLGEIGRAVLHDPIRLALGPGGLLAVVDRGQGAPGAPGAVVLFPPDGSAPITLASPVQARSVTFDPQGNLYIGSATGSIYRLAADSSAAGGFRIVGAGASGMDGEVVDLAWNVDGKILALIREQENGQKVRLWDMDPSAASAKTGLLITTMLDSKLDRCQWHRIYIKATIPQGTTLEVDTFADNATHTDAEISDPNFQNWKKCVLASHRNAGPPAPGELVTPPTSECAGDQTDDADCLVQSDPGRYLWIRLTFHSACKESPEIQWLRAFFPRESYLEFLPAVYQQDDVSRHFLDRFLCLFQAELEDLDGELDDLWLMFDPASVNVKFLRWLASWLALDIQPEWTPGKIRQALKQAISLYATRGTVQGLQKALTVYSTVDWATIIEHFRLRQWPLLRTDAWLGGGTRLWSPNIYHQVQVGAYSQVGRFQVRSFPEPDAESVDWGASKFSVFFPADPYTAADMTNQISAVVEREKPAHTEAQLCPVFPRFRVGVQSSIGVDSRIGGISHLVLNQLSTLNYDSILGCTDVEREIRERGSAMRPEIGTTTKLS
jgi:phage tail-like protein